jgi:hypothetical protein
MKKVAGSIILVFAAASFSAASVNVEVNTPNASVRVGTPPPAPRVTVVERERIIVREDRYEGRKDNGKHKGQKKHKKHKKNRHDD